MPNRYPPRLLAITASYSENASGAYDGYEISGSSVTFTLQSPAQRGRRSLSNTGSAVVTIATAGTSATIDGAATITLFPGESRTLVANGLTGTSAVWRTVAKSTSKAYVNTAASTALTNTTTETVFDTYHTIPANTLKVGTMIRVHYQGIATATQSTDTLAVKLYLATDLTAGTIVGTALISHAATDVADNNTFAGYYNLIVRTVGASGTVVGDGWFKSVPAAEGTITLKDDILASTALDTTVAQYVAVSGAWSVAAAANSCRLDVMSVEVL